MKTTVAVEPFEVFRKRSLARAKKLAKGEHVASECRISFERAEDMAAFMTAQRVAVLRAAMAKPRSVTELAAALKRNRPAVSRDVRALNRLGLVELNRRPNPGHGQIQIVRAAARKFDFRYQLSA